MGRKYRNLYDSVCSFENILLASRKARRGGKRTRPDVAQFEYDLEKNIFGIRDSLADGSYAFGGYNSFTISDPKERVISKALYRDRVVHHALCNIIEPILDRAMISDSYACRKGKGSHRAIARAEECIRKYSHVLKIDVKKYFFTIDHEILLDLLETKISDDRVMSLIRKLLATYSSEEKYYYPFDADGLFDRFRPRGLPIGNLTSQLFANFFLSPIDRFIKETLGVGWYIRYMDDMLVFSNDKAFLKDALSAAASFLNTQRLSLNAKKSQAIPVSNGVSFLGFNIGRGYKRIRRENLQRFKRRMREKKKRYALGCIDREHILLSLNSWLGYADKERNFRIISRVLSGVKFSDNSGPDFRCIVVK